MMPDIAKLAASMKTVEQQTLDVLRAILTQLEASHEALVIIAERLETPETKAVDRAKKHRR